MKESTDDAEISLTDSCLPAESIDEKWTLRFEGKASYEALSRNRHFFRIREDVKIAYYIPDSCNLYLIRLLSSMVLTDCWQFLVLASRFRCESSRCCCRMVGIGWDRRPGVFNRGGRLGDLVECLLSWIYVKYVQILMRFCPDAGPQLFSGP